MVFNEKADEILAIVPRPVWVGKLIEVRVSGRFAAGISNSHNNEARLILLTSTCVWVGDFH